MKPRLYACAVIGLAALLLLVAIRWTTAQFPAAEDANINEPVRARHGPPGVAATTDATDTDVVRPALEPAGSVPASHLDADALPELPAAGRAASPTAEAHQRYRAADAEVRKLLDGLRAK